MSNLQPHRTLINQWKSDYEQLKHVLEQEQLALESQTFDTLSIVTQQKNQMVNQINSHQVPPIMTHSGESLTNLNSFRRFCLDNKELKDDWLDMMSLVEKCCFKNEVNARLIQMLTNATQRTFNLIKGFDPDNRLYNQNGNSSHIRHSTSSITA